VESAVRLSTWLSSSKDAALRFGAEILTREN
jgi:hypothetical protein